MNITQILCQEFGVQPWQIEAVVALLDEGATLPFIARYRKEQHGSLDDQQLRDISDRLSALRNIEQRRGEISESLKKLEVWTEELQASLDKCTTLAHLEDVYRPYRPKRRTLSIEVGMQNAGLATVLAARHFPAMPEAAVAAAICCVWHSITGTLLAGVFNAIDRRRGLQ